MDKIKEAFKYVQDKFSRINEAQIKEDIFFGLQICKLIWDVNFDRILWEKEKTALKIFKSVATNFLGNERELVENLLMAYKYLGCNMSLKNHFLDLHLDQNSTPQFLTQKTVVL